MVFCNTADTRSRRGVLGLHRCIPDTSRRWASLSGGSRGGARVVLRRLVWDGDVRLSLAMTDRQGGDELAVFQCAGCGVPLLTFWAADGGGMLRGEYLLAGDTVWHPKCWDVQMEKYENAHGEEAAGTQEGK